MFVPDAIPGTEKRQLDVKQNEQLHFRGLLASKLVAVLSDCSSKLQGHSRVTNYVHSLVGFMLSLKKSPT